MTDFWQRGLPYSNYFSHISEKHGFPLRTTVLSLCFCSTYGLLYLISTTAFNSIITSAVLYLVRSLNPRLHSAPVRISSPISVLQTPHLQSSIESPLILISEYYLRNPTGPYRRTRPPKCVTTARFQPRPSRLRV